MAAPLVKPILCPILIGRGRHLTAFQSCLNDATAGHGQALLVAGEAGIGKSRLISEVGPYAVSCGFRVVMGHCFEQDEAVPYAPLVGVFRTLLQTTTKSRPVQAIWPFASDLLRALPELSELFSELKPEPNVPHEPQQEKHRIVQALTLLVSECAAHQPLFLVIEDVQWCDEASLDALLYLARHIPSQPVLLVLTYRNDEESSHLDHMLSQLDRERLAAEMRLLPLSVAEVEGMVRAIFGLAHPVQAEHLNLIYSLSDGNPFFVEEMLRTLAGGDTVLSSEALTGRLPLDVLHVPRTVDEAVQRRVARLNPASRRLVGLAAVAGRSFSFALLQALTHQDERSILEQLKELIAAQLVVEISDERFAFRHALTRQAVYAGLLARERQSLHQAIAEVLEQANDPPDDAHLGDLAYHFSKAAAWRQALTYAQSSGERALALYAPRAALEHLLRALEAAGHLPDVPKSTPATLHRLCGRAYEILGDFEAARAHYTDALHLAQTSGDHTVACSILVDLGNLWTERDYTEAGAFYEQATELAQSQGDALQHAHSLNRWGNWCVNTGRTEEGIGAHERALVLFEEQANLPGQAVTLDLLGMAYGISADLPSSVREFSRAIDLFRALGDTRDLSLCLASRLAFGSACMADTTVSAVMTLSECWRDAHEAERCAREMEWSAGRAYVLLQMGRAEVVYGAFGSGLTHIREALELAGEIEHQQWMAGAYCALGRAYVMLLASGRAILELERGLAIARKLGSAVWMGLNTADLARAYRGRGELASAERVLCDIATLDTLRSRNSLTLVERELALQWAELALQRGDPEMSLEVVAQLDAQAHRNGSDQPIAELLLVQGAALISLRRWEDAQLVLEEAKRAASQRLNPSSLWRAQALLARLYHVTKQAELARKEWTALQSVLEQVAATVEEADLRDAFLQAALADIPRAARVPLPHPTQHIPNMLTRREREVATLIAQGKSNLEIADALTVSERTVTTHVSHILGKLGLTSRTQVVAWMIAGATGT
jgi:DNA-binding CsgD family transcriptional regulator/tetratricopeptide (TPR) repeat protein